MRNPKIIIVFGSPGAGKDTQAAILAKKFKLTHFLMSNYIQKEIFNVRKKNNPTIKKQLKLYLAGKWCAPYWVTKLAKGNIQSIHKRKQGIIMTGFPRTLFEAWQLMPFAEKLYGQDNIYIIKINIKDATAVFRVTHRRLCEKCKYTIVYSKKSLSIKKCPKCGGRLIHREIDSAEITKKRLREDRERTLPVFKYLRKRKYSWIDIDGELVPDKVTKQIFDKLMPLMK